MHRKLPVRWPNTFLLPPVRLQERLMAPDDGLHQQGIIHESDFRDRVGNQIVIFDKIDERKTDFAFSSRRGRARPGRFRKIPHQDLQALSQPHGIFDCAGLAPEIRQYGVQAIERGGSNKRGPLRDIGGRARSQTVLGRIPEVAIKFCRDGIMGSIHGVEAKSE